jgi:hypothetical protein
MERKRRKSEREEMKGKWYRQEKSEIQISKKGGNKRIKS